MESNSYGRLQKHCAPQIVSELKKGFKVIHVQRFGEDRGTVYKVQGVQ